MSRGLPITPLSFLHKHWGALTIAFIAVLGETLGDVLEPWPVKVVIDSVLQAKKLPGWMGSVVSHVFGTDGHAILAFAVAAVIAIALIGAISSYVEKYLTVSVSQWVTHDLRRTLYDRIQRFSLAEFGRARTGDLISRITDDIEAIQDFITSALLGMVVNALTLVGMIGVMFYINWKFTLISLAVAPMLFGTVFSMTRRIKDASRAVRKRESELVSVVEEVLTSERVVKAFAREDYELRRFETESLANVEAALQARGLKARLSPFVNMLTAVGTAVVLGYGAHLALRGRLTAGVLIVFLMYLNRMYKPMRELSKMTNTVSKALVGYERIQEVLTIESSVRDLPRARRAPHFKGQIEFRNVTFSYQDLPNLVDHEPPPQDEPHHVLREVTFRIMPGQTAAFVGPSGTGKTTILSLIARFYDPLGGAVLIDGWDIKSFTLKSLRNQISFVLQDTILFHATVWENIAYGKPDASRDEIIRAAMLANAHEFIETLPRQYDTLVGERGETLSGGQRQRIAIARALIRNTPILILDEPTSALDPASEQVVIDAMRTLMKGRTSVVVAHHLETITEADVIFVINDAELVEHGTHDELSKAGGIYSELYDLQRTERNRVLA
jgi:subfamily B ATP-binding cassette protein MsbA